MTDLFEQPHGIFDDNGQTLLATEIEEQKKLLPAKIAASEADESRASRLSKVERRIVKKSSICERCRLNDDPNKVPVHPHCDCDVITDSLESGVADPTSRFFNPLTVRDMAMEMIATDVELPAAIQLNADTAA